MGLRLPFLGLVAGLALSSAAHGAAISYPNATGATVIFKDISEDSSTDPTPLFGAPSIGGDTLLFNPISFGATSSNGVAPDITDGTLKMQIAAKPGFGVHTFSMSEAGDYTLAGTGTGATAVSASAQIFIRVTEINGLPVTPFGPDVHMIFTPNGTPATPFGGQYHLGAGTDPDTGIGVIWHGSSVVDIDALLAGAGYNPSTQHATLVSINMDNTLTAFSEAGTIAFIKKKNVEGLVITVPEPASLGMLFLGASVLLARRRA